MNSLHSTHSHPIPLFSTTKNIKLIQSSFIAISNWCYCQKVQCRDKLLQRANDSQRYTPTTRYTPYTLYTLYTLRHTHAEMKEGQGQGEGINSPTYWLIAEYELCDELRWAMTRTSKETTTRHDLLPPQRAANKPAENPSFPQPGHPENPKYPTSQ